MASRDERKKDDPTPEDQLKEGTEEAATGQETAQASNVEENVREATTADPLVTFRPELGRQTTLPSSSEVDIPERKKTDSSDSLKGLIGSKRSSDRGSDTSGDGVEPEKKLKMPLAMESGEPKEGGKEEGYLGDRSSNESVQPPQAPVRFRKRASAMDSGKAKDEDEEEPSAESLVRFRTNPPSPMNWRVEHVWAGEFSEDQEARRAQAQQLSESEAPKALEDFPSVSPQALALRKRPSAMDSGKAKEEETGETSPESAVRFRANPSPMNWRTGYEWAGEFSEDQEARAQAQQPSGSAAPESLEDVPSVSGGATQGLAEMVIRKDPKKEPEDPKEE